MNTNANISEYVDAALSSNDTVFTASFMGGDTLDVVYFDAAGTPRRTQRRRALKVARQLANGRAIHRFARTW
jgi:hypothetical protein